MADPVQKENRERSDLRRTAVLCVLLGFLYAAASLAGSSMERNGYLTGADAGAVLKGAGLWLCFSAAVFLLWTWLDRLRRVKETTRKEAPFLRHGIVWIILCLMDLISLLAVYPGFFVYDASEELAMVQSRMFTTHHPLLHVLLMGGVILAVHKVTASWNAGIFVYILLQMLVINGVFAYVLADLEKRADKYMKRLGFLWLAFCPAVTMFVLCSCKDGLFAASLLVMTVELRHLLTDPVLVGARECLNKENSGTVRPPRKFPFGSRKHVVLFLISASLMMLFRNNGVYAYAVFFVILLAAVLIRRVLVFIHSKAGDKVTCPAQPKSKEEKAFRGWWALFLFICIVPIAVYFGISKGLAAAVHATSNESQEILTVPIMQLGRTWQSDRSSFSTEEQKLMAELVAPADSPALDSDEISEGSEAGKGLQGNLSDTSGWNAYNPVLSDQLKLHFRSDVYRSDKPAFWEMYFHQLKVHPVTYLNAWLMTSYGFWYPEAVIDCYKGNTVYTFTYGDSSYFGYETEQPGTRDSLIPALDRWYRFLSLDVRAQKIPVLHLSLSPGMMAWIFAFLLFNLWRRRKRKLLLVYLPTFLVWLTVLLGPCTLPRYVVYLWFEIPLMLGELFSEDCSQIRISGQMSGKRDF